MAAGKAMIFARLRFAVDCVAVGDFALCHLGEATILAFVFRSSTQQSAFSQSKILPQRTAKAAKASQIHICNVLDSWRRDELVSNFPFLFPLRPLRPLR
jgi:hypothetical protein